MKRTLLILIAQMMLLNGTHAQYDRAVVALTKLNYVYYNVENPISVAVPGLLPKDIVVSIGEDKAFLHRDPDGSNRNDLLLRPKDSTGTVTVHIDEILRDNLTQSRGKVVFQVVKLPNPTIYLSYSRQGDTIALEKLLNKENMQVKAVMENFDFEVAQPEVLSFYFNRSESFQLPIEVEGSKLTGAVRDMMSKARRDETIYLDNIKVRMPDGRTITLKAEFPLE